MTGPAPRAGALVVQAAGSLSEPDRARRRHRRLRPGAAPASCDLDALGGLVTKAVSSRRAHGAPAPRVAEFGGGMINAVGLANPGVDAVRRDHLPWLARALPAAHA